MRVERMWKKQLRKKRLRKKRLQKKRLQKKRLQAGYTVEAAGVMAVVFLTIMILIGQAFRIHAETAGCFFLHTEVEQERHSIERIHEREITMKQGGSNWQMELSAPVFRPEEMLRMWSLTEERE